MEPKDDTSLLLLIVAVALVVTLAWAFLSKEENAKVASVVLTSQGCVAASELAIEFKPLPEGTCSVAIPGMNKYGDKLYISDSQIINASHVVSWRK